MGLTPALDASAERSDRSAEWNAEGGGPRAAWNDGMQNAIATVHYLGAIKKNRRQQHKTQAKDIVLCGRVLC